MKTKLRRVAMALTKNTVYKVVWRIIMESVNK